jgi:hypothetical protein
MTENSPESTPKRLKSLDEAIRKFEKLLLNRNCNFFIYFRLTLNKETCRNGKGAVSYVYVRAYLYTTMSMVKSVNNFAINNLNQLILSCGYLRYRIHGELL